MGPGGGGPIMDPGGGPGGPIIGGGPMAIIGGGNISKLLDRLCFLRSFLSRFSIALISSGCRIGPWGVNRSPG